MIAAILALVVLALLIHPGPAPEAGGSGVAQAGDVALYDGVIGGVRAGGNYYQLAADALRAGSYPLRPFLTFRLPTHSIVQAALPPMLVPLFLYLLVLAVAVAWWVRLAPAFTRGAPRVVATILMAAGLAAFVQADLVGLHEVWAGLLVALALALRRPGDWMTAAAIALVAMLVRETAALLPLVMAWAAWREGAWRETGGWLATLGVLVLVLAVHAYAVDRVTGPLDPASPGWAGHLGLGFGLRALATSTALIELPAGAGAALALLAVVGWTTWTDPLGRRTAATIAGYLVALALFARADTFYWALMPAPVALVGLAFLPDALRDLAHGALDRRRVRVHRITQ